MVTRRNEADVQPVPAIESLFPGPDQAGELAVELPVEEKAEGPHPGSSPAGTGLK